MFQLAWSHSLRNRCQLVTSPVASTKLSWVWPTQTKLQAPQIETLPMSVFLSNFRMPMHPAKRKAPI